jgi:hypothetical protein
MDGLTEQDGCGRARAAGQTDQQSMPSRRRTRLRPEPGRLGALARPDVSDVAVGDPVLGTADWAACTTAGASDRAIMDHWTQVPAGLDLNAAAALPHAVETGYRSLGNLGDTRELTILVYGAETTCSLSTPNTPPTARSPSRSRRRWPSRTGEPPSRVRRRPGCRVEAQTRIPLRPRREALALCPGIQTTSR